MAEAILPGVYIDVRAEGLIAPGRVTVGNLGAVGTAARGPVGTAVLLGSYADAVQHFYHYDAFTGTDADLTLVRALEQAFEFGATTVFAVRVAGAGKAAASADLKSATGTAAKLTANSEGTWGNDIEVNVQPSADAAPVTETFTVAAANKLKYSPVLKTARTRISVKFAATGITRQMAVIYDDTAAAPTPNQVKINRPDGALQFGDPVGVGTDEVTASYLVDASKAVKVTLQLDRAEEVYVVVDGSTLVSAINDPNNGSSWVVASAGTKPAEPPSNSVSATEFAALQGGQNGETGADYQSGLDALLNEEAHIIIAAGQNDDFGGKLAAHCAVASTDAVKHDRIAVVGSKQLPTDLSIDRVLGHNLDSDRLIFVAPGIQATDTSATPPAEVTLPGAYAAAAVAGLLAALPAHISLTNKPLGVDGLEKRLNAAELTQLVQNRVVALEQRQGFRVVKGITTSTDTAFAQITTRRIVDFAKFSVRSAADSYIGRLNNERVRAALKSTVSSALQEMLDDEMLTFFKVDVTATRDEEIKGIARVTIVLQPTFSIDFIKVTMILQ